MDHAGVDHAGVAPGRLDVEESHPAARDLADRHHGMQHSGRVIVRGVAGFAFDFQDPFAAGQRLTDVGTVTRMRGVLAKAYLFKRHEALL